MNDDVELKVSHVTMNLLEFFLIGCVGLFATVYVYLSRKLSYWRDKNIKHAKASMLWGNLGGVGHSVHLVHRLKEIYDKFGRIELFCGVYYGTAPKLMVLDLDLIKSVLDDDFKTFHSRGLYFNAKVEPISEHVYHSDGERWLNMRTQLTSIFTPSNMKQMIDEGISIAELLKLKINDCAESGACFDGKNMFLRFSADLIGMYTLHLNSNAIEKGDSGLLNMVEKTFDFHKWERKLTTFLGHSYPKIAQLLGVRLYSTDVEDFFRTNTIKTIKYREVNDYLNRSDLLAFLLKLKANNAETRNMELNDLTTQIFLLFIAGLDTLATTMTFCLYELALNQKLQDAAREDIKSSLGANNGKMTNESIDGMAYLTQVVYETLRKYPPVHTIYRRSNQSYSQMDFTIPDDTSVIIPVYAIHHNSKIYPNPDVFDPDRFTAEHIKSRHPASFLPFGMGPRKCVGHEFAVRNIKMAVAILLANFTFTLNTKTETSIVLDPRNLLLDAKGGVWFNVCRL